MMYPLIEKSYKAVYPFRLATTSFIYPDDYVPNVKMLGPYLDEIELLLFESLPLHSLPSRAVIAELGRIAREFGLSFNVHLPIDVSISDSDPQKQTQAVDAILKALDLVTPLGPSACTLHIPYNENSIPRDSHERWEERVYRNLKKILGRGIPPELIAVETLDYSLDLLDGIIDDLGLSICLDLGHLMARAVDIKAVFNTYGSKTSIIHLHGFNEDRDHMALDRLSAPFVQSVLWILKRFKGTVSLEVFSFGDLNASLVFMDKIYHG